MAKTLSAATLPQLQLTEQDKSALQHLSLQLQREIVSQYETFLFQGNREVDEERWKHARSLSEVHAFVERKSELKKDLAAMQNLRHSHYSSGLLDSDADIFPQATLAVESQLRRVLVTGLQTGMLDDLMHGSTFHDTLGFQAYWTSQHGIMSESAVLATIKQGSDDDPFQFMGVTWFMRTFSLPSSVLKRRDMLTLTSVQLSNLSNGDRIGVSISHSIKHRDLSEFHEFGAVRATTSVLRVFRQFDSHRVEVFTLHSLDTKGSTSERFDLKESIGYMLPSSGYSMAGGFRKKLRWIARYKQHARAKAGAHNDWIEPSCSGSTELCELCCRAIKMIFHSSGTSCDLCLKRVCVRCSVPHEMANAGSKATDVCVECILQAKRLSAVDVAREEHLRRQRLEAITSTSPLHRSSHSHPRRPTNPPTNSVSS